MGKYKRPFSINYRKPVVIDSTDPRFKNLERYRSRLGRKLIVTDLAESANLEEYSTKVYWTALAGLLSKNSIFRQCVANLNEDLYAVGNEVASKNGIILKYDKIARPIYVISLSGTSADFVCPAYDIAIDSTENIYTLGNVIYDGTYSTFLTKHDSNGDLIFAKQIYLLNNNVTDVYPRITIDSLDNIYVTTSKMTGTSYTILFKYDRFGVMLWQKKIFAPSNCYQAVIDCDSDNNVIMCVSHTSNLTTYSKGRFSLLKINGDGELISQVCYRNPATALGSTTSFVPLKLKCDLDNNVYVSMLSWQNAVSNGDDHTQRPYLIKLDSSFSSVWQKAPSETGTSSWQSWAEALDIDTGGNIYWGLHFALSSARFYKLATDGSKIFSKSISYSGSPFNKTGIYGITIDKRNKLNIVGYISGSSVQNSDFSLRIPSDGSLDGTYPIYHDIISVANPLNFIYSTTSVTLKNISYTTTTSEISITLGTESEVTPSVGSYKTQIKYDLPGVAGWHYRYIP